MTSQTRAAQVPGFTSETASVGSVRLHYRLSGNPAGPPVLLWHGFLGTSYTCPVVALGGQGGLGVRVREMV